MVFTILDESTASFNDNDVYAFMVENPNGSNLLQQDLEQIHKDDLEAMDLKLQLSLLSMRAKRYLQRTCKKIFINANDTAGYDKSKVECFNCHKMGYFARECRASRNKRRSVRNQDNTRKHGNNEDTSSKAMLAIDGVGFDWSDMADERVNYNYTTNRTHPNAQRNMVPKAVLMKTGLKPFNTAVKVKLLAIQIYINTAKAQAVNTARPKTVKTARPNSAVVNAVRGKPLMDDKGFVDSGCSRHMTGNIAYLSDFKEFDGGYVTFGGGAHGGRISGKGTLKTDSLDFEDVHRRTMEDASYFDSPSKDIGNGEPKSATDDQKQVEYGPYNENDETNKFKDDSSPKEVDAAGQHVNTVTPEVNIGSFKLNIVDPSVSTASSNDHDSPKDMFKMGSSHTHEATHVEFFSDEDEPEVDLGNILNSYTVPTTPNTRIHKDHPITNVIEDIEPTSISKALSDSSWVEAMQEELLQFKLQQVWILMDLPNGKMDIGTKWVFRNKKDERGIVIRNKARLVAQGHRQEEGIDYEEVFAHMARIKAIRLFLAYASFMGFLVYQMDVKSAFLYGTIEEEVYVTQPPGFKDPDNPDKFYKVVKALYGLHQAPRAWLISWQCKKQTVVATSTTKAEYVAAASCCGQVLWIQNQLLDYGYNFMNTVINIDNNSTICIIENPVQHSKTKHIEIRHHFIRDCNAKKLIQMVKIHTDHNVADLLTKGFDAGRFQYLVSSIGMLNP
ncbi:putative ribonuclease H-like domain-containing protein [Tanacetum coccineum]